MSVKLFRQQIRHQGIGVNRRSARPRPQRNSYEFLALRRAGLLEDLFCPVTPRALQGERGICRHLDRRPKYSNPLEKLRALFIPYRDLLDAVRGDFNQVPGYRTFQRPDTLGIEHYRLM